MIEEKSEVGQSAVDSISQNSHNGPFDKSYEKQFIGHRNTRKLNQEIKKANVVIPNISSNTV